MKFKDIFKQTSVGKLLALRWMGQFTDGVFVVARKNETTELLQAQFPTMMRVFTSTSEAAVFINSFFEQVFSSDMVLAVRQAIQSEQDKYLTQLAKSWFV